MFLFWYRIPWITCNNRNCVYRCGFVAYFGLPSYGQSPFGVWILNLILTLRRRGMAFPLYLNLLLGFIIRRHLLLWVYILYMCCISIYIYADVCFVILQSIDINLSDLEDAYTVKMNPFEEDNAVAESSAQGAARNAGGRTGSEEYPEMPGYQGDPGSPRGSGGSGGNSPTPTPRPPHYNPFSFEGTSHDYQNYDPSSDGHEGERCPTTYVPIDEFGICKAHGEAPCIEEDPYNLMVKTNEQGYWDPTTEKFVPLTMRQYVLNKNRVFHPKYIFTLRTWEIDDIRAKYIAAKANAVASQKNIAFLKIRDLNLSWEQKQYLRHCILRDAETQSATTHIFMRNNIDLYPLTSEIRAYLVGYKRIDPFADEFLREYIKRHGM